MNGRDELLRQWNDDDNDAEGSDVGGYKEVTTLIWAKINGCFDAVTTFAENVKGHNFIQINAFLLLRREKEK